MVWCKVITTRENCCCDEFAEEFFKDDKEDGISIRNGNYYVIFEGCIASAPMKHCMFCGAKLPW